MYAKAFFQKKRQSAELDYRWIKESFFSLSLSTYILNLSPFSKSWVAIYTFESAWNLCCHLFILIFIILRKYIMTHLPLVYCRALATIIFVSQFNFFPSQGEIYWEGGWHWICKILLMTIIPNVLVLAQWNPDWLEETMILDIKSCLNKPAMILWKQCAAQRKKYDWNLKSNTPKNIWRGK